MAVKRDLFRQEIRNFSAEIWQKDFDSLNDYQRTYALGFTFILKLINQQKPGIFPEEYDELEPFICDGANDQGIDLVFSDGDDHYFMQFKYRSGSRKHVNEDDKEVETFFASPGRLHPLLGKQFVKNDRLTELLSDINWAADTFHFWYVSLGSSSPDIDNLVERGLQKFNHPDLDDLEFRSEVAFFSESDLNSEIKRIQSQEELSDVDILLLPDSNGQRFFNYITPSGKRSLIGSINIAEIHQIYQKAKDSLFNLNIRNFIGENSTNKQLMQSADEESENFFFYNNGISAVCDSIDDNLRPDGRLHCKNFSVINGAQTFRSLHKVWLRLKQTEAASRLKNETNVMIRITEVGNVKSNAAFVDKITRFNNTQNAVQISDFRSNDPVQLGISKLFYEIAFNGKTYYYQNKRSGESKRKNRTYVKLDDFCKTIYAFKFGPIDCFGGKQHLYDSKAEVGGYWKLFRDPDSNKLLDHMPPDLFEIYGGAFLISETCREFFKQEKARRVEGQNEVTDQNPSATTSVNVPERALQGLYLIVYTVSCVLAGVANELGMNQEEFIRSLKPLKPENWRNDKNIKEALENAVTHSCDLIINDYSAQYLQPKFVHRNYMRSQEALTRLKQAASTGSSMINKMIAEKFRS